MARTVVKPRQVTVSYRGIPYTLDLVRCRRALVWRQVEGNFDNMMSLARACGISRSTASRFFSGRVTSLTVTLKILKALKLEFEEVARPESDQEDATGSPGGAARANPPPRAGPPNGLDGAAPPGETVRDELARRDRVEP